MNHPNNAARALGLIETAGYGAALTAADAALKAAAVEIVRIEPVIGSGGSLGVTLYLSGDVASVQAAVSAGESEVRRTGRIISVNVIPNLDTKVKTGMFNNYLEL